MASALDLNARRPDRPSPADVRELREALQLPLPSIPSRHFYDERGSRLFEAITRLPEYYLTRAEHALLARAAPEIARRAPAAELVELGGGASPKVRLLLDALRAAGGLRRVLLVDISAEVLGESARQVVCGTDGTLAAKVVGIRAVARDDAQLAGFQDLQQQWWG